MSVDIPLFSDTNDNPKKTPVAKYKSLKSNPSKMPTKQFFEKYMSSPIYQQRLAITGQSQSPTAVDNMLNTNIVNVPNYQDGSSAYDLQSSKNIAKINKDKRIPIDGRRSNIIYDPLQSLPGKTTKDAVMAHELSHISRPIGFGEQTIMGSLNKSPEGKHLYDLYKNNNPEAKDLINFSNGVQLGTKDDQHSSRPDELKADLDALRYMMYKNNIYDTSKRDMTIEDYKKAIANPEIKNSLMMQRLKRAYKPEDLIRINNIIASNSTNNTNNNV